MSTWRREMRALLPAQRNFIDRASSFEALWHELFAVALARSDDEAFLDQVILCALSLPKRSATAEMRRTLQTVFLDPLLIHQGAQCRVLRHLSESAFLDTKERLARRVSPAIWQEMQTEFSRLLAARFRGTDGELLREIKGDLLAVSSAAEQDTIRRLWHEVLVLVEVGEVSIGMENFLDNLCESDIAIPKPVAEKFRVLASMFGKSIRDAYFEP